MPAQDDSQLIEFQDWTVRVRPAARRPARLLVLIHGLKGDESSMWVFARDLRPDYWILAPRAPNAVDNGGYSWRPLHAETVGPLRLEMLEPAVDQLLQLVDAYSASVGVDAAQFDLLGFSQGAAMVGLTALLHSGRVRKAGVLSGFLPGDLEELIAQRPLESKSFFVAHGTQDDKVPISEARRSIALLEQAGAKVTYCEAEVGHKVSAACLRALKAYLRD